VRCSRREDDQQRTESLGFLGNHARGFHVHPTGRLRFTFAALDPWLCGRQHHHIRVRAADRPPHVVALRDVQDKATSLGLPVVGDRDLSTAQCLAEMPSDKAAGADQQNARWIRRGSDPSL